MNVCNIVSRFMVWYLLPTPISRLKIMNKFLSHSMSWSIWFSLIHPLSSRSVTEDTKELNMIMWKNHTPLSHRIVTFLPFKKRLNMSSLITKKVKIYTCLVSVKAFIVRPVLCATILTYTSSTTISFAYYLFASNTCPSFFLHNYSLFCSQPLHKH